jgi:hypothetical protein
MISRHAGNPLKMNGEPIIMAKKIVLTGGGTAGHVTPNIALLPSLREAGYEIYYIGSYDGIEARLIKEQKIPYYGIASGKLRRDFRQENAVSLLRCHGYDPERCEHCVKKLACKLRSQPDFPHEIGLFLGYPPEDVQGFICQGPDCCKCSGCWKVYGDPEAAQKTFDQYKKCTRIYCQQHAKGASLDRLAVAKH